MSEKPRAEEDYNNSIEIYTGDVFVCNPGDGFDKLEAKLVWCGGMTLFDEKTGCTGLIHFVPFETEDGAADLINTALYQIQDKGSKGSELTIRAFMLSDETVGVIDKIFNEKNIRIPVNEPLEMDEHGTHFPLKISVGSGIVEN